MASAHTVAEAAVLACRQPKLVAKKVLQAGLCCEVDLYLECQKLYKEIYARDPFSAEVFATELRQKGLVLACAGTNRGTLV